MSERIDKMGYTSDMASASRDRAYSNHKRMHKSHRMIIKNSDISRFEWWPDRKI